MKTIFVITNTRIVNKKVAKQPCNKTLSMVRKKKTKLTKCENSDKK